MTGGKRDEEVERIMDEMFDLVSFACGLPADEKVIAAALQDNP